MIQIKDAESCQVPWNSRRLRVVWMGTNENDHPIQGENYKGVGSTIKV